MVEVFYVIRRGTWQKALVLLLVIAVAAVYYTISNVKESTYPVDGRIVFVEDEHVPTAATEVDADRMNDVDVDRVEERDEGRDGPETVPAMATPILRLPSFDGFRASRLQERSRRMEQIEEILSANDLSDEHRAQLYETLLALSAASELETQAEGLLIARGLQDAVVVLGTQAAEVVVPERITRDQAGQIGNVVARITGLSLNQITIVDGAPAP